MRGQVQDTEVRGKSPCVRVFEWLQMRRGWLFHRACEKLDLVELCQPGGQKSVMFAGLYSNQTLCREVRKEMVYEEETERKGGKEGEGFHSSSRV